MPKVSIIIPTYNCAKYISDTLESVLNQTYRDFEIIIIDSSTDTTKDVLMRYRDNIKYLYQKSRGVAAARNIGIEKALGEYIAFLDSDDIWLPKKLELQMSCISNNKNTAMIFTDGEMFDDNKLLKESLTISRSIQKQGSFNYMVQQMKINDGRMVKDNIYEQLLFGNFVFTSSVLVNKKAVVGVGCFDENLAISEDYDLWLRLTRGHPAIYLNNTTAKYRVRDDGLSGGMNIRGFRWAKWDAIMLEKHYKNCDQKHSRLISRRIYQSYINVAWKYLTIKELKNEARTFSMRALRYDKLKAKAYLYILLSFLPAKLISLMQMIRSR